MEAVVQHAETVEKPVLEDESTTDIGPREPARVILFNDEIHTFEEVIGQIIKATACSQSKAESLTWQVHSSGKAVVFEGPMNDCLRVAGILEEIALHTHIEV
jgi:ATP-dependent Clp protease adaptor protein ClpS